MVENEVFMDWEKQQDVIAAVREKFPEIPFPNVSLEPVFFGRGPRKVLWEDTSIVTMAHHEEDGDVLTPVAHVSSQYLLVPHEVVIQHIMDTIESMDNRFGDPLYTISLPANGAKLNFRVRFPESGFKVKGTKTGIEKDVQPEVRARSSYDKGWEYGSEFGAHELVCSNGLIAFKIMEGRSKKHRLNLSVEEEAAYITQGMESYVEQNAQWNKWADAMLPGQVVHDMLEDEKMPFGPKHLSEILALPEAGTSETLEQWINEGQVNGWRLYGVFTQFMTHELESELVRAKKEPAVTRFLSKYLDAA